MKTFKTFLVEKTDNTKALGDSLGVDWNKIDLHQFKMGLSVEAEHDDGGELDVVDNQKDLARIVLAHLKEVPDYYTQLKKVEEDAPANSVAAGGIAGLREPIIRNTPPPKKYKKNKK